MKGMMILMIMVASGCATTTEMSSDVKITKEIEWLQEDLAVCRAAVKECPASVKKCNENYSSKLGTPEEIPFHGWHFGYCEKMEAACIGTEEELLTLLKEKK